MRLTLVIFFLLIGSTIVAKTPPSRVGLLTYRHGSSKLTALSKEKLESLYLAMLAYPGELVSINSTFGYADEDEGELYNKRIRGVIDYMCKNRAWIAAGSTPKAMKKEIKMLCYSVYISLFMEK